MYLSKKLVTAIVAVLAIVGATTAFAAIPGGGGVIHGCYDKSSGQLRVTDTDTNTPKTCSTKEAVLNWNQQGPQGPAGTPGISGLHEVDVSSPNWTTTGEHSQSVSCPTGERALGFGYTVIENGFFSSTGSAAARVDAAGSFNPAGGGYGVVSVYVNASILPGYPAADSVSVNLALTCATVAS